MHFVVPQQKLLISPVNTVSHGRLDDLAQNGDDSAPEPLILVLQVEHFVHQEQHDSHWNVVWIILMTKQGTTVLVSLRKVICEKR